MSRTTPYQWIEFYYETLANHYDKQGATDKAVALLDKGPAVARRAMLPSLASDYAVETEVRGDLAPLNEFVGSDPRRESWINDFDRLVKGRRQTYQEANVDKMHGNWLKAGGELLVAPDQPLDFYLKALVEGKDLVAGGRPVSTEYFGTVDPSVLNNGIEVFKGGPGQVKLLAALGVATGKFDFPISTLPRTFEKIGGKRKQLEWKNLPIDWRRGHVILSASEVFQSGTEGYLTIFPKSMPMGICRKDIASPPPF